jgi:hypothetical protein
MKILLSGYEGSKFLLPASSYLINKYLGADFDVRFLNYGKYTGKLFCGRYEQLAPEQVNGAKDWAKDISAYLAKLEDEFIIFGLDDYLISAPLNIINYCLMLDLIEESKRIVCARLCISNFYKVNEYSQYDDDVIILTELAQYSATTQYCIWRRDFLIELLSKVNTPWEFEIEGSKYLNQSGKKVIGLGVNPPMVYPDCSALSSKWQGVRLCDNPKEDVEELVGAGLL